MADITLEQLTTGSLTGTGVFDKLMEAVNVHLDDQFDKGRIKGTDYANVYLGSIQSVIAQSIQFLLTEQKAQAEAEILETQKSELVSNGAKDRAVKDAQIALYGAQQAGFAKDASNKYAKTLCDYSGLIYASDPNAANIPSNLSASSISTTLSSLQSTITS